ncbi:MAG TPA: class I SAM-dependent rRNA methyltransferase [Gemmatimonadaceae bacterium]|nr:class I SAM-dependent rRNA methyltransferase [Gemmatimonadaceae bacterium]
MDSVTVNRKAEKRWAAGHPWIFRSDVLERADSAAAVRVVSARGKPLGVALWSPKSEISLRMIDSNPDAQIDSKWWHARLGAAVRRRSGLGGSASAYRLVHGEADGCPSLVCDRYGEYLVVQLLSAGLEAYRREIVDALVALVEPAGILARNDVAVRAREGLPRSVEALHGQVPREIEVEENGVRYLAAPWDGQKTGAFLDQRENRALVRSIARGRALDCFSYHGSFALHLAGGADTVIAIDSSAPALDRARANAALNGFGNIELVEADTFEFLRDSEAQGARYDTIVLDPPAFAKTRQSLAGALRGYKEINLRGMRLLSEGGYLFTASCSFHLGRDLFFGMLAEAAADSGRTLAIRAMTGQPSDHPEIVTIPETSYIKGALLQALD